MPFDEFKVLKKIKKNNSLTLCNKSEYKMLHDFLHTEVPKIGDILLVELNQSSQILALHNRF